jgi:hypothetical protein
MKIVSLLVLLSLPAAAADVEWSRFVGRAKLLNMAEQKIGILNSDGDLVIVPVTRDVRIYVGKEELALNRIPLHSKVTLIRIPELRINSDTEGLVPPEVMESLNDSAPKGRKK